MAWMRLTGYADKFGVHPGDTIRFYVNCDGPKSYDAQLVKMINGDTNPRGPGLIERKRRASLNGSYKGRRQVIHSGSYGFVEDNSQLRVQSFTLQCWVWPTTPKTHPKYWKHGAQGLVTKWHRNRGYGLFINEDGCAELRINGKKVTTRRAAARPCLALPGRDLQRRDGSGDPLSRAAGGLRPRPGDQAREGEDRGAGAA